MTALERLIDAYAQLNDTSNCPDVTYFPAGQKGIVKAALAEQAELIAALRSLRSHIIQDPQDQKHSTWDDDLCADEWEEILAALLSRFPEPEPEPIR